MSLRTLMRGGGEGREQPAKEPRRSSQKSQESVVAQKPRAGSPGGKAVWAVVILRDGIREPMGSVERSVVF